MLLAVTVDFAVNDAADFLGSVVFLYVAVVVVVGVGDFDAAAALAAAAFAVSWAAEKLGVVVEEDDPEEPAFLA